MVAQSSTPPKDNAAAAAQERARRGRRWALAALLFPLFFTAVVAIGVVLMFKRNMGFFKPAPSGNGAAWSIRLARNPVAHGWRTSVTFTPAKPVEPKSAASRRIPDPS